MPAPTLRRGSIPAPLRAALFGALLGLVTFAVSAWMWRSGAPQAAAPPPHATLPLRVGCSHPLGVLGRLWGLGRLWAVRGFRALSSLGRLAVLALRIRGRAGASLILPRVRRLVVRACVWAGQRQRRGAAGGGNDPCDRKGQSMHP